MIIQKFILAYNPTAIANYFITKYKNNDMSLMKVIKLTYLTYC